MGNMQVYIAYQASFMQKSASFFIQLNTYENQIQLYTKESRPLKVICNITIKTFKKEY